MSALQGTEAWKLERAGNVTASRVDCVLARIKSGEAAVRRDYRAQLIAEILTGIPQEDGYQNAEMIWGTENEPMARSAYEISRDILVEEVGFIKHQRIERSGASCDGLVGADGIIEIKAPKTATHLQYLLDGEVPPKYHPQILWNLACTGRSWCDFISYDPRLSPELQLFVVRFPRDDKRIAEMEAEVLKFLAEVDAMLERLRSPRSLEALLRGSLK